MHDKSERSLGGFHGKGDVFNLLLLLLLLLLLVIVIGVISSEADLKLRAQLLPELYDTKSNY